MTADKVLEEWRRFVPPEVPADDVLLVVRSKFEKLKSSEGGHYRVFDSRLLRFHKMFPNYPIDCLNGTFSIPTVNGRKVKGVYVKIILGLLEIVEKMTEKGY